MLVGELDGTEQLLRRMVGSITEYIDLAGARPLRITDYDKAVLAIHDGEVEAFRNIYPSNSADSKKNRLKPHRSDYWCLPSIGDAEFIAAMEDVLDVYELPYDPLRPVYVWMKNLISCLARQASLGLCALATIGRLTQNMSGMELAAFLLL